MNECVCVTVGCMLFYNSPHVCAFCVCMCVLFSLMRENDERKMAITTSQHTEKLKYYQGDESLITEGDREREQKENM